MKGDLTLRIYRDGASIRTFFRKLIPRFEEWKESTTADNKFAYCTEKVDSKKCHASLQWQSVASINRFVSSTLLCMVKNEIIDLHVLLNPTKLGFFTTYIPVYFTSNDDFY